MRALRDEKEAEASVLDDLETRGMHVFSRALDPWAASALLERIRADRTFDHNLFLSEAEFDADPQYKGVNPRPGRNLLDRFAGDLGFVEADPQIVEALTAALGEGYDRLDRKIVCGVPASAVPAWVKRRIEGKPVNNLGPFVKPQYRDVTYFYGIDFHQDLIDHPAREADFLTLYVYLHAVTRADAPLFVLEGSHRLGGTVFPHDLTRGGDGAWRYGDRRGGSADVVQHVLTGEAGFAAIWHACTLHGTQPDAADRERISLRYLIARRPGVPAGIDRVNAALKGPLSLASTRVDLAADGSAQVSGNIVRGA